MTQPFDANEFRRQQIVAGQVPQGAPQVMPQGQPQHMQPRPMPAPQPAPQPQMPHYQPQPAPPPQYQGVTQPQQVPQHQQHMPPQQAQRQAYQQAMPQQAMPPPPMQQQPQQAYAPPPSAETEPVEAKKSVFKRGTKAPKPESGSQGRSPALVFTTGLLTGVLFTILGLKMMGQKAERPTVSVAAAIQPGPAVLSSTVPGPNAPSIVHEPQIAPVGEVPSRPIPKPVTP